MARRLKARSTGAQSSWSGFLSSQVQEIHGSCLRFSLTGLDTGETRTFFAPMISTIASRGSDKDDSRHVVEIGKPFQMSQALSLTRTVGQGWRLSIALALSFSAAYGQRYDITPLVGARYGGSLKLEQQGAPNVEASLADSI